MRALLSALTATVAVASAVAVSSATPAAAGRGPDDLRELAKKTRVEIGSAVDVTALAGEADYRATLNREFNAVTAENAMKWESVEPQRGVFDWSGADAVVNSARANRQTVRGHTLVWHSQLPAWLTEGVAAGTITSTELRGILRDHIKTEVGRYRGKIAYWDVVNEAFNEDGTLRQTIWLEQLGPGYIADAFRWAHQADPKAKLYYNDFNLEAIGPKSDAALALVRQLQAQRVPIHGVGFQGHLAIQFGFPADLADNFRRFAAAGVDVALTEVDVRMPLPVTPEKEATQAQFYRDTFAACVQVRRCVGYTVWGFTDRHSWVPGFFAGEGSACLLDENLATKPAYDALLTVRR